MGADWRGAILESIPSFGYIHVEMFANLNTQNTPIHRQIIWHIPVNKPVAAARNQAVEVALEKGCEYVYFRDYDVLAPPDALNRLIARIEAGVGQEPEVQIVGGLYCSKQKPPWPLLFKQGKPFMNWRAGDVVKCDNIGMGCTLIRAELFERLGDGGWFETINERPADAEDGRASLKTRTEDVYFSERIRDELGVYPYIDTGILCVHKHFDTDESFYFDPNQGLFVWSDGSGKTHAYPPIGHELCHEVDATSPPKESDTKCENS